jgi:uncharacterized membrane protein YecN with MAPEG domain
LSPLRGLTIDSSALPRALRLVRIQVEPATGLSVNGANDVPGHLRVPPAPLHAVAHKTEQTGHGKKYNRRIFRPSPGQEELKMNPYLLCSAILVLLYFALALNVSLTRRKTKTGIGAGNDPAGPMNKAVRAHGNAAEYIPIFVALFLYFLLAGAGGWITWVVVIVTVSRVLHALGMLMSESFNRPPHPLRAIGALGTYVGGFALGVALLMLTVI